MLMRREDFRNRLIHLLGTERLVRTTCLLDDASRRLSRFLLSQLILNVGFGIVVAIGLFFIGIPYAYVWGAIGALLRYVPFLGGWLAPLFPLLASLVLPSWTPFFVTAIFFIVLELLQAYLIEPLVFGHSIGISGAGQLIAALFWVCLWGPMGLILSTPLTAWICVLGRQFPLLRTVSELMGEEAVVEKSTAFYQRLLAEDISEAVDLVEEFLQEHSSAEVCDELFMPALLAAQNDEHAGELAREHQLSIAATMREIFEDVVAPAAACEMRQTDEAQSAILRVEFPFNGDTDRFIAEMLETTSSPAVKWANADAKDVNSKVLTLTDDHQASIIFLATAARKHHARVRGACKKLRDLFPDAEIVVGCWGLEDRVEYTRARLKAAGATAVCTTLAEARQLVEGALPPCKQKPAATITQEIGAGVAHERRF
jgi:hypothetical protein